MNWRGATWEHSARTLAKALSAKERKPDAPSFKLEDIDELEMHYNIDIDSLETQLTHLATSFMPTALPVENVESKNYEHLAEFLNSCLDACKTILLHTSQPQERYHWQLKFIPWDKPTRDGCIWVPNPGWIARRVRQGSSRATPISP